MDSYIIYLILFSIIVALGQLFEKSTIPIALILVISGMLLSFIPFFPEIRLDPKLILNIFLPLLIYQITSFSSWRDMKKQARPIALLSIGHVLFITIVVAIAVHALIPAMSWPLAFVLGAIISPPDAVAITSIAEKIKIPERIFLILEGEGVFNDAAALTLFRLALAAAITNQFSVIHAFRDFCFIIIGETLYGIALGHLVGWLRTKISNTSLHVMAAFITPFLAYVPAVKLGGSGIVATAIVGFMIGNHYTVRFTPEYRLTSFKLWPALAFAIQGLIFLLVGLNLHSIYMRISSIPLHLLIEYIVSLAAVVIIGRFVWVYAAVFFLPRLLSPSIRKNDPYPPWQYPFIVSWSGVRGGISLAAALSIPVLTLTIDNIDIRDLMVFLVFCIIFATLILQGLSLPFILRSMGMDKVGHAESHHEYLSELQARLHMLNAALHWLEKQSKKKKKNEMELSVYIHQYQLLKHQLENKMQEHSDIAHIHREQPEPGAKLSLLCQLANVEKDEISKLWRGNLITFKTRNKLLGALDLKMQRHLLLQ